MENNSLCAHDSRGNPIPEKVKKVKKIKSLIIRFVILQVMDSGRYITLPAHSSIICRKLTVVVYTVYRCTVFHEVGIISSKLKF